MNESFQALYQQVILPHSRKPVGYEKRPDAMYTVSAYNPICGDKFELYVDLADSRLKNLHFYGYGCAISKASLSILVETLRNTDLQAALHHQQVFLQVVDPNQALPSDLSELFQAFEAARAFPERKTCATLGWDAIGDFLREKAAASS